MGYISYYDSPLGKLALETDGQYLLGLYFETQEQYAVQTQEECAIQDFPILVQTQSWLNCYFAGEIPDFRPALLLKGSSFREAVWHLLLQIPYGQTVSYGELARQLAQEQGRTRMSAQAVGGAVGHNPIAIIVPCHRVIGTNGSLTGYAGGLNLKSQLLASESWYKK